MSVPHLTELKTLKEENAKLKRMYAAELALAHNALQDVVAKELRARRAGRSLRWTWLVQKFEVASRRRKGRFGHFLEIS